MNWTYSERVNAQPLGDIIFNLANIFPVILGRIEKPRKISRPYQSYIMYCPRLLKSNPWDAEANWGRKVIGGFKQGYLYNGLNMAHPAYRRLYRN